MREEHLETTHAVKTPLSARLLAHAHWAAFIAAVALWALHLAGVVFPDHRSQELVAEGIPERKERLDARLSGIFLPKETELARLDALAEGVQKSFAPLEGSPPQVTDDVTYSPGIMAMRREGARNEILFLPPRDLQIEVKMGSLALTWVQDGDNNIAVHHWEILRSVGAADFVKLATAPAEETRFEDGEVEAGKTYGYRVLAVTEDETVSPGDRRSQPTPPQRAEAASDVRIQLIGVDLAKKQAVLEVEKWHKGAWWKRQYTVGEGQAIGARDTGTDVDYSTGRTLKSLTGKDLEETSKVEMVTFDADGRVLVKAGNPVLEEVSVTEKFIEFTAVVEGGSLPRRTLPLRQKK